MAMNYNIHDRPNWFFEVVTSISEYYLNTEEKVIKNHKSFGLTMEEMEDFFSKYRSYKKAVMKELSHIYKGYPSLEWLFKPVDYRVKMDECMGVGLIVYWGDYPKENMDDALIDDMVLDYISRTLADALGAWDEMDLKIGTIKDLVLVDVLENNIIDDDIFKMHIIRLYHTRQKTIRQLWEMIQLCVPVVKKHYPLIEEDVKSALQTLPNAENLEGILKKHAGLNIKSSLDCNFYPTISNFNRLKFELMSNSIYAFYGIYFLKLLELKESSRYKEDELVKDLKALGDPTRFKIIQILLEREMFLKELAEKLNLTSATVSHHISILQKSNLISITIGDDDGRKVLYQVNREKLQSIGDSISKLSSIYSE